MRTARFALVADGTPLCVARELDGFFADPATGDFRVVGAEPALAVGQRPGRLEVRVLDDTGEPIGTYALAGAAIGPGGEVSGRLLSRPHPLAGEIWARWRASPPAERNQWAAYPSAGRAAWLEVTRMYTGRRPAPGAPVAVAGEHVTDRPSVYLALGEAVRGPGGYLGANLDGLHDCLRGVDTPLDLVWRHAEVASERVGPHLREVLAVLAEDDVSVTLA